jgi:hypothetical protein
MYMSAVLTATEIKNVFKVPVPLLRRADGGYVTSRQIFGMNDARVCNVMVAIDPDKDDKTLVQHMALERPQERNGRIVGPDGKPLTGVSIDGLGPDDVVKGAEFTVRASTRAGAGRSSSTTRERTWASY